MRSNPIKAEDDTPLLVLPEVSYYGKRFFLKNMEVGFTLWENPSHQLNILLTPSLDQRHFNRWDINNFSDGSKSAAPPVSGGQSGGSGVPVSDGADAGGGGSETPLVDDVETGGGVAVGSDAGGASDPALDEGGAGLDVSAPIGMNGGINGGDGDGDGDGSDGGQAHSPSSGGASEAPVSVSLKSRKMAGLAGLEYMYSRPGINLHFQSLLDVTSIHGGHELRFAAILPFESGKSHWAITLGLNYQSRHVIDYYYGVDSAESSSDEWVYHPKSAGVSQMLRLDWQRPISEHWSWRAMLQYSRLSSAVAHSPIIFEPFVSTFFVGGVYHF